MQKNVNKFPEIVRSDCLLQNKIYKKGYVPGVYDLFHIGHLNLIRRCKARCEYLIVGVLTDELVEFYKKQKPIIPFCERAEIISALRDVDEVIAVTFENTNKIEAWKQLHYDCHFSGSDHSSDWIKIREKLRALGSDMEFFPYTEGTSSTRIKELILNAGK